MRINRLLRNSAVFTILVTLAFSSCRKDDIITDPSAKLSFSTDTLLFDTVFTTTGSSTRQFKVYNTSSDALNISNIRLGSGTASNFRMNVDGASVISTANVVIAAKDSLYVFVDVTVNPNNSNNPLLIKDSVIFETNGNIQSVILEAVGQDAYFHYQETLPCNAVWTNDKPHLIYDFAIIPPGCKLTMQPGTRVHLHNNAILAADSSATLEILGSYGNQVVFQGDRPEPEYQDRPGQWGFIWLSQGSKNNIIDWAVIKNGNIGVLCDTLGASANPTLRMTNTIITNMALYGFYGRGTYMNASNCVFSNCAQYTAALTIGGSYSFRHCTFGNYWDFDDRGVPQVLVQNWYEDIFGNIQRRNIDSAHFYNCIIYGNNPNEVALDSNTATGLNFRYLFHHSLLKTDFNTSVPGRFVNCSFNQDPYFKNVQSGNFRLNASSAAMDIGDPAAGAQVPKDLDNMNRPNPGGVFLLPDAGAYEYY